MDGNRSIMAASLSWACAYPPATYAWIPNHTGQCGMRRRERARPEPITAIGKKKKKNAGNKKPPIRPRQPQLKQYDLTERVTGLGEAKQHGGGRAERPSDLREQADQKKKGPLMAAQHRTRTRRH
jgi:hypothetical protein